MRCVWLAAALLVAAPPRACDARSVTLSNTELPFDSSGALLLTGEAAALFDAAGQTWTLLFNNWGGCAGVDCCDSPGGCASCCFNPPSSKYPDACVYTTNHTVVAYTTADFETFIYAGVALQKPGRHDGIEFRPHVIPDASSGAGYLMWYEDRFSGNGGYSVARSASPAGPYVEAGSNIVMHGSGRTGDFDVFVDDDDEAYHVRTGFVIERLNTSRTGGTGQIATFSTPTASEGPVMFKREGVYYVLAGSACCACIGGSSIYVFTAASPLGDWVYRGEVGANASQPFDRRSPLNFETHAQASAVLPVVASDGSTQFIYLANQWVTSTQPGRPRDHDLLFWAVIGFTADGNLTHFEWRDDAVIDVP